MMRKNLMALVAASILVSVTPEPGFDTTSLKHIANVSYASESLNPILSAAVFSPRMDFDQWKPLTGRGDPLKNDPTYDYEPPVLERVRYWAEDTRLEREHYPQRKSEVLMLGVSSRRPSAASRTPITHQKRHHRPFPPKYEDFTYKLSEHYPMTILVPPPLPPPSRHTPPLLILTDEILPQKQTESPSYVTIKDTTRVQDPETYSVQESNLIYQSSTTDQNWVHDFNTTHTTNNAISSDYAGWGPTTPLDEYETLNDTQSFILNDHIQLSKHPYSFYKPMLSEAPPPLPLETISFPSFLPTVQPPVYPTRPSSIPISHTTQQYSKPEVSSQNQDFYEETTTETQTTFFSPPTTERPINKPIMDHKYLSMFGSMLSMPMVNGPERAEDNLYAHASENLHIFKQQTDESIQLETMQTMLPPPIMETIETTTVSSKSPTFVNPHSINNLSVKQKAPSPHDPYLHMRFTTSLPALAVDDNEDQKTTTTTPPAMPYLIIQGHSKVKTYGSKSKSAEVKDDLRNEIPKHNISNEVKHLHTSKEKYMKASEKSDSTRSARAQNLKSLLDRGVGTIDIQETDIGIKYDVSDGSKVPVEIYRKGIVDNEENDYSNNKKKLEKTRTKRQINLEDILPFDEDTIEEYIFNYLNGKKNETGITGLIAQAVTSDAASAVDDLENEDDDEDR